MSCPEDKKKKHNPGNPKKHRRHTPIVSKAQQGLFGAELARRRAGEKGRMPGITTAELERHLEESEGKKLPERIKRKAFHRVVDKISKAQKGKRFRIGR